MTSFSSSSAPKATTTACGNHHHGSLFSGCAETTDDSSASSTFRVHAFDDKARQKLSSSQQRPTLLLKTKPRLKLVQFDELKNMYYLNRDFAKTDCQRLWYNRNELQRIRSEASALVTHFFEADRRLQQQGRFTDCLRSSFSATKNHKKNINKSTYSNMVEDLHQACCAIKSEDCHVRVDPPTWERLRTVCFDEEPAVQQPQHVPHSDSIFAASVPPLMSVLERRGLEFVTLPSLHAAREERRGKIYRRLHRIQGFVMTNTLPSTRRCSSAQQRQCAATLRTMSERTSRASRLFAQYMAQASFEQQEIDDEEDEQQQGSAKEEETTCCLSSSSVSSTSSS